MRPDMSAIRLRAVVGSGRSAVVRALAAEHALAGVGRSSFGSHGGISTPPSRLSRGLLDAKPWGMKWHSALDCLPQTDFQAEPASAETCHPSLRRSCPSGPGCSLERSHRWSTCARARFRSVPVSSARRQAMYPDPADEPRTNDQEGLTASGDQASDLDFLVAGAGFEPATSGL